MAEIDSLILIIYSYGAHARTHACTVTDLQCDSLGSYFRENVQYSYTRCSVYPWPSVVLDFTMNFTVISSSNELFSRPNENPQFFIREMKRAEHFTFKYDLDLKG